MTADLPLKEREVIRARENRRRKRVPEARDRCKETVAVPVNSGVGNLNRMWMSICCLACAPWTPQKRRNTTCQLPGTATVEISIEERERERQLSDE